MTSAAPQHAPVSSSFSLDPAAATRTTPSSPSGAVPAQSPVRSYPPATKTATPTSSLPAGGPSHNAKSADTPVNGHTAMAQGGGPQTATNSGPVPNGTSDHSRKPSVVISASGASGYTSNGGPVGQTGGARPPISFGSMNQTSPIPQPSQPSQSSQTGLPTPQSNPRVISPAHSPSPIPQPQSASGGRPPSSLQGQGNGLNFGSMGGDQNPMQPGVGMHERRTSSQSMHSGSFSQSGRGRGGYPQQNFGNPMHSPGPMHRPMQSQGRPAPFQQAPNSPFGRGGSRSPAPVPNQPHMPPGHMGGNPQMQYGGPQQYMQMQQGMYGNMPGYDPYGGYYQPYYQPHGQYGNQGQSQSPRPPYPNPYGSSQGPMNPPYHPQDMSRSASQSSQRPPSSMGQPDSRPGQPPQSHTPVSTQSGPAQASNSFVRPAKKSNAIKITDAQGNEINFAKSTPPPAAQTPAQTPVIVSTPNAPTPPPRVPSSQHNRTESKPVDPKLAQETKNSFQELVRKQKEKAEAEEKAKTQGAVQPEVKQATAEAEKTAAVAANDNKGAEEAKAAESATVKTESGEAKAEKEETEEERMEREIAEMEAAERAEEEREKAYQEKKARAKAEEAKKDAEKAAKADEELKRQEREAEERELAREREREAGKEKTSEEPDEEAKSLFASLKKPTLGPGASATDSGADTPASEDAPEPEPEQDPTEPARAAASAQKPKPAHLKLETTKRVEPAEPTPGMQALKSARFLEIKEGAKYPEGIKSPNPALNMGGTRKGHAYDKDFLLQFQSVFKEKPSMDWDQKVKETLGPSDEPGSARGGGSRTPSGAGRSASSRGPQAAFPGGLGGPMGSFVGGPRTLPAGTTSEQRFMASQMGGRPGMAMPGQIGRMPSNLGMGAPGVGMSRTNSLQAMSHMGGPNSPRQGSQRGGKGGSKRGDRTLSKKEEADMASKMPLTAHMEITPLEKSTSGWKPISLVQGAAAANPTPDGHMAPDLVQRKVKAALNKMTPEKFAKISDQILEIVAQSKNESDGRTLRQVIQLTFEKACDEAHWAGMYAQFCQKMLTTMSSDIRDETIKDKNGAPVIGGALFRKYLLNRCQEEFERGWQANLPEKPEGDAQEVALMSDEYYVAAAAKRRGLGLIQFIGQLYKLKMLTLRIMHECVLRLLNFEGDPDEAAVENLTTLLKSVGSTMDEDETGQGFMSAYFQRIDQVLLKSDALGSRPKFMIMDLIDLRKAGWKGKGDASKGPKTLDEIHAEAAAAQAKQEAERQRTQRGGPGGARMPAGRGDARNFQGGMPPPVDYARTNVAMDDLRRLQNRGASQRSTGGGLGPGGSLGPGSTLGARAGSRRGNLGPPSSGHTTRTNTPPVGEKEKKDETQSNAFSALASLDPSGEGPEDGASQSEAASPPSVRASPAAVGKADDTSSNA